MLGELEVKLIAGNKCSGACAVGSCPGGLQLLWQKYTVMMTIVLRADA